MIKTEVINDNSEYTIDLYSREFNYHNVIITTEMYFIFKLINIKQEYK